LPQRLPARFTASDRLQDFPTGTSRKILRRLAASSTAIDDFLESLCGKSNRVDETDGLRIFLDGDEIVHFRPSGNAPELRCYAESASQERSEYLVEAGLQRMKSRRDS
jgi:phosphomannomutase